jgi:hypothetical protein
MAGHSRSKNGVASLRLWDPAIHVFLIAQQDVDARVKPAHDERKISSKAEGL